jgi:hypothetical protein
LKTSLRSDACIALFLQQWINQSVISGVSGSSSCSILDADESLALTFHANQSIASTRTIRLQLAHTAGSRFRAPSQLIHHVIFFNLKVSPHPVSCSFLHPSRLGFPDLLVLTESITALMYSYRPFAPPYFWNALIFFLQGNITSLSFFVRPCSQSCLLSSSGLQKFYRLFCTVEKRVEEHKCGSLIGQIDA